MTHKHSSGVASDVCRELVALSDFLHKHHVCDARPITSALTMFKKDGVSWGYQMGPLVFSPPADRLRVVTGDVAEPKVELDVSVEASITPGVQVADPFIHLSCNIQIKAKRKTNGLPLFFCWHLDREDSYDHNGVTPSFIHPRYHMQHGGSLLKDFSSGTEDHAGYGSVLISDTPRFVHPPLEAILGVDFILTNFYPNDKRKFREEQAYRILLASAQERYWRPYALAIAQAWSDLPVESDGLYGEMWPSLVESLGASAAELRSTAEA
jgi:hypothetical protein